VRRGLFLSFSVLLGCAGPEGRSDAESWPAPPAVSGAAVELDPASVLPATEADGEGEQPAVLFRCDGGRLGAYVVTAASGDDELFGEQMVPISLDSAPSC
jgi:hypothetical protein